MNKRDLLKDKKRIIIKVGTALLTDDAGKMNLLRMEKLAHVIADLTQEGKEILLVSSGAVGAGLGKLKEIEKPQSIMDKQALAAVGQAAMLRMYDTFFNEYNISIGQVLLTRDGIENSIRRKNARNTLSKLLEMKVIPIINENDTVATEEIEFGDNDLLSALVANLIHAELLIILTNTDGIYTSDPSNDVNARQVSTVLDASDDLKDINLEGKSHHGSGGMRSKIEAAELCRKNDIDVVIAKGEDPEIVKHILSGEQVGTLFVSDSTRVSSKQ